jgi:hypothetical protein
MILHRKSSANGLQVVNPQRRRPGNSSRPTHFVCNAVLATAAAAGGYAGSGSMYIACSIICARLCGVQMGTTPHDIKKTHYTGSVCVRMFVSHPRTKIPSHIWTLHENTTRIGHGVADNA